MIRCLASLAALCLALAAPAGAQTVTGPVGGEISGNVTAPGGLPQTLQTNAAKLMTVEDFGAKGDNTTDDANAFDAYAAYLRAQVIAGRPQLAWVLGFGRKYFVSRSIDLTGFQHFRFEGNGSFIRSTDTTHPAVDMLGAAYSYLENIHVACGSQATPCLTGITFGTTNDTQGQSNITFNNVEVDGYFTRADVQNSGSELFTETNLIAVNRYTSGTPGSSFVLIEDGVHHWALNSLYVTDTRTPDVYFSFTGQEFTQGSLFSVGDGSAIWESSGRFHHFNGTYLQVLQPVPSIVLFFVGGVAGTQMTDYRFNIHSENAPSTIFKLTGAGVLTLAGFNYREEIVQVGATGSVFTADTGVTNVNMTDSTLFVPYWLTAGAKLFDQPALYKVNGKITLMSAYSAAFNGAAAFSGLIVTDAQPFLISHWTPPTAGSYNIIDQTNNFNSNFATVQLNVGAANVQTGPNGANLYGTQNSQTAGNAMTMGVFATDRGRPLGYAFASGEFSILGDAQTSQFVLRGSGNSTTPIIPVSNNLGSRTGNNCVNLTTGTTFTTDHRLMIKDVTTGDYAVYTVIGAGFTRPGVISTTTAAATVFPSWVKQSASSATASAWNAPVLAADTSNGCPGVAWTPPGANTDTFHVVDYVVAVEVQ
jgi:hypothetical protein